MTDGFQLPGIVTRWVTLMLSIAGMLVLVSRWTAQIDGSIGLVQWRLQNFEERASRTDVILSKLEGIQHAFDERMAKLHTLERDSGQSKKAMTDMHTSVAALTCP